MSISNDTSNLIFFAYWDRRRLPAGRKGRPKRPIINYAPIIFLPLLPTGKVADNQFHLLQIEFNFRLLRELPPVILVFSTYISNTIFKSFSPSEKSV
jgi:hypothetical protein